MSRDLPYMSRVLVQRIATDPKVKMHEHWKFINVHIGGNDFCIDICYRKDPYELLRLHKKHLTETLRTFRDFLPKTMVNVVVPPGISFSFFFSNAAHINVYCLIYIFFLKMFLA